MAIVIGGIAIGAWELAAIATAAVTAVFLSTPAGQEMTSDAIDAAAEGIEQIGERLRDRSRPVDIAPPIPRVDCPPDTKKNCPPCPPPPPPEIDRVPPSRPHKPCPGDHWHYYEYHQNPVTCKCYGPYRRFGGCLPQGGNLPAGA